MNYSPFRALNGGGLLLSCVFACSGRDTPTEEVAAGKQHLTQTVINRILSFEGTIGANGDWVPTGGTVLSSTLHATDGTRSLVMSGASGTSIKLVSTALSALGTVGSSLSLRVWPSSTAGQTYQGVLQAFFNSASLQLYNSSSSPVTLSMLPTGRFSTVAVPIDASIYSKLSQSTYTDLKVTIAFITPDAGQVFIDQLAFAAGGTGSGGAAGIGGTKSTTGGSASTGGSKTGGTSTTGSVPSGGSSIRGGSGGAVTGGSSPRGGAGGALTVGSIATGGAPIGGASNRGGSDGTPTGGAGNGGASSGNSGSAGKNGTAGVSAQGGFGGSGGATGNGGTGGAAGAAGAAGTSGAAANDILFIELASNLEPKAVALASYGNGGGLIVNDGTKLVELSSGYANVSSVRTTAATDLGVATEVNNLYSTPDVFVRGSHIHGNVMTSGGFNPSPQITSIIDGTVSQRVSLSPVRRLEWSAPFWTSGGPVAVADDDAQTIAPGTYADIAVGLNAHLTLSKPGVYAIDGSFVMEPGSVLRIENTAGEVELYVRSNFYFRGTIEKADPRTNFLIGVLGAGDVPIDRAFDGILVAPYGTVQLGTTADGHRTSVYAKAILARPHTTITHTPFDPAVFCEQPRCGGLCPSITGKRHCELGEPCTGDADCADELGCQNGVCADTGCRSDAACAAGMVCGQANGRHFGVLASKNVCWDPGCAQDPFLDCGSASSRCGANCSGGPSSCSKDSDCPQGEACGTGNGPVLGASFANACWPKACQVDPQSQCGTQNSPCGVCACKPNCDGKTCNDLSDGCGGQCTNVCQNRMAGCSNDADCQLGSMCFMGAGARIGLASTANVCLPEECRDFEPLRIECGSVQAKCGICPTCEAGCGARECGPDPNHCVSSCGPNPGGTCSDPSQVCSAEGKCGAPQALLFDLVLPDGRTFSPLPMYVPPQAAFASAPAPSAAAVSSAAGATSTVALATATISLSAAAPAAASPIAIADQSAVARQSLTAALPPAPLPPAPPSGVGAIPGYFEVSDRGLAQYSIPIRVPPARAGRQPALTLEYSSQKAAGLLGVGWRLGGLSTISRCAKTPALDGYPEPVLGTSSDRFCLDGKRLVLGSAGGADYGSDGAVYRTDIDSSTKMVSYVASGHTAANGPTHFKVWTKPGLIMTYGATEDSSVYWNQAAGIKRAWALQRVEDHVGNYFTVLYGKSDGTASSVSADSSSDVVTLEIVPDTISYNGFDNGAQSLKPNLFLHFAYEDRSDRSVGFLAGGHPTTRTRRMNRIDIYVGNTIVRSYLINYEPPATHGVSRVSSVQEIAGNDSIGPTQFEYYAQDDDGGGFEPAVETGIQPFVAAESPATPTLFAEGNFAWFAVDANGDGADDLLVERTVRRQVWHWQSVISKGVRQSPMFDAWQSLPGSDVTGYNQESVRALWLRADGIWDHNRDGRDDILEMYRADRTQLRDLIASASFGTYQSEPLELPVLSVHDRQTFTLLDIDGDGIKDLYWCEDTSVGESDAVLRYYKGLGRGGISSVATTLPSFARGCEYRGITMPGLDNTFYGPTLSADIDGDGSPNLLRFSDIDSMKWAALIPARGTQPIHWKTDALPIHNPPRVSGPMKFVDFNGDGLKDLVAFKSLIDTKIHVWLNTGNAFIELQPVAKKVDSYLFARAQVIDYDGDGLDDLLWPESAPSTKWNLGRGTDQGLEFSQVDLGVVPPVAFSDELGGFQVAVSLMADVDGDGNSDLLLVRSDGMLMALFGKGNRRHLVNRITNGVGKRIDIEYAVKGFATGAPTYGGTTGGTTDFGHGIEAQHNVGPLVSAHYESQVLGSNQEVQSRAFEYHYAVGATDTQGRGFLGFETRSVREYDGSKNLLQTTVVRFDPFTRVADRPFESSYKSVYIYPFLGLPTSVERKTQPERSDIEINAVSARVEELTYIWGTKPSDNALWKGQIPYLTQRHRTLSDAINGPGYNPPTTLNQTIETFIVDGFGNLTNYTVNAYGPTVATTLASPRVTTTWFPADLDSWFVALPESITTEDVVDHVRFPDGATRVSGFTYDENGLVMTETRDPPALTTVSGDLFTLTTTYHRNEFGNVDQVTTVEPDGGKRGVKQVDYESTQTYPKVVTNLLDQPTYTEFDPRNGMPILAIDPNALEAQWSYDAFGRLRERVAPGLREVTTFTSSSTQTVGSILVLGALAKTTAVEGGEKIQEVFDAFGRTVQTIRSGHLGANVLEEMAYDTAGSLALRSRPHSENDTSQGVISYLYDKQRRLTQVLFPDNTALNYGYATFNTVDAASVLGSATPSGSWQQVRTVTDQLGHRDVAVQDERGNRLATFDATGARTDSAYDAFNTLRVVTSGPASTSLDVDRYGRTSHVVEPDTGEYKLTYTGFGDVKLRTEVSTGKAVSLHYDALGRLDQRTDEDGTTTYVFDKSAGGAKPNEVGRLVSMKGPSGHETRFEYEPTKLGFLQSTIDTFGSIERAVKFEHDNFGNVTRIDYPEGDGRSFAVKYERDANGSVTRVTSDGTETVGAGTTFWELKEAYQGYLPKTEAFAGGVTSRTRSFDALTGRLVDLKTVANGSAVMNLHHTYDAAGKVNVITDNLKAPSDATTAFCYDSLDRLTSVERPGAAGPCAGGGAPLETFQYASSGNIAQSLLGSYDYTHPGGVLPHAVATAGELAFGYDARGNQTKRTGTNLDQTLKFTAQDLPSHIDVGSVPEPFGLDFEYDGTGQRVAKTRSVGGAATDKTLYVRGFYEQRTTRSGLELKHAYFVHVNGEPIAQVTRTEDAGAAADSVVFLHPDRLGSLRVITDPAGNVLHSQTFSAFGSVDTPSWSSTVAAARDVTIGFTGHRHDVETGLVDALGRIYDPLTARFLSPDPLTQAPFWSQGLNRYSYVYNNPTNAIDPSGFEPDCTYSLDPACKGGVLPGDTSGGAPSDGDTTTIVTTIPPDAGQAAGDGFDFAVSTSVAERLAELDSSQRLSQEMAAARAASVAQGGASNGASDRLGHTGAPVNGSPQGAATISEGERYLYSAILAVPLAMCGVAAAAAIEQGVAEFLYTSQAVMRAAPVLGYGIPITGGAVKAINLPGWSKVAVDMEHIAERHMTGGALTEGRDVFVGMGERGVMAAIRQAYGSATTIGVQGERVFLSGITKSGMTVEMWFNKVTNLIETAYPVGGVR